MNDIKNELINLFSQILGYEEYNLSENDISLEEEKKLWEYIKQKLDELKNDIFELSHLELLTNYVDLSDEERLYIRECLRIIDAYKDNIMIKMPSNLKDELLSNKNLINFISRIEKLYKLKKETLDQDKESYEHCQRLRNVLEKLENLKDEEYIDFINEINESIYLIRMDFKVKLKISKLIARYNVLVGEQKKNKLESELEQLKIEAKDASLLNTQMRDELEKLFEKYGYDINLLSPEMLRKMILRGNLNDMEDVFEFYKKINLTLKLNAPSHEKYLYILYKSNKKVLDELLDISIKYNINIKKLLATTSSIFIPKRINSGQGPVIFEGVSTTLVGANEDFIENVKLLEDLGYDIKDSYEKCPSIFVYSNNMLKQNVDALKTYGLDIKQMQDKIKLTGLKNSQLLFTIDQFIELDEISYLFNNTSRLQWAPNEAMFYRLYDVKKYNKQNPNNEKKYKNVDQDGNTISFKSFVSQYQDNSTGITAANKLTATNTINPNVLNGTDLSEVILERLEYCFDKNMSFTEEDVSLIKKIDEAFKVDNLRYNINGKTYSRYKFIRVFRCLKDYNIGLTLDEVILISMTYNSIIDQVEYLDVKNALESLMKGRKI